MKTTVVTLSVTLALVAIGCTAPTVDFAAIQKPAAPEQMSQFRDFVGTWTWEAELVSGEGPPEQWTGTANWDWVLGGTYLHGELSAAGPNQSFSSSGSWGWHPKKKTYVWWMLNDWGYPQEGTAKYDPASRHWTMKYTGVGLDGTTSYGCYTMKVVDDNTLDWTMTEWADWCRCIKKVEMTGTYKRQ